MSHFKWTDYEYSLKEMESFGTYYLPCLVEISQGFCSFGGEFCTFAKKELFRIERLETQTRLVVQSKNGSVYSIPIAYPIKFKITAPKKLATKSGKFLEEILTYYDGASEKLTIEPENVTKLKFLVGADRSNQAKLTQMQVVDVYEEKFFVANAYNEDKLWDATIMPLFVDIKLRIAEEVSEGGKHALNQLMQWMENSAAGRNKSAVGTKEIMLFKSDEKNFMYAEPESYITCEEVTSLRDNVQPKRKSKKSKKSKNKEKEEKEEKETSVETEFAQLSDEYDTIGDYAREAHQPDANLPLPTRKLQSELKKQLSVRGSRQGPNKPVRRTSSLRDLDRLRAALPLGIDQLRTLKPLEVAPQKPEQDPTRPVYRVRPLPAEPQAQSSDALEPEGAIGGDDYVTPVDCQRKREFQTMRDVPLQLQGLSRQQVADCLFLLKLERLERVFLEQDIDGTLLLSLDANMLTSSDFNLSRFEAAKLLKFVAGWRPKD